MTRRSRRSLVLAAIAVVGLVAAAVVVPWLGSDGRSGPSVALPTTSPAPPRPIFEDLPLGERTDIPWWAHGALHVGATTIPTPLRSIVYAGGTTVIGRSDVAGSAWYLVDGDQMRRLVSSRSSSLTPVVSSDGSTVAWAEEIARQQHGLFHSRVRYRIVAFDVAAHRQVGVLHRSERVACCDAGGSLTILGVLLDGRVLMTILGRATVAWQPGREPVRLAGPLARRLESHGWPRGVSWQGRGGYLFYLSQRYGTVDRRGRIRQVGSMPTNEGMWSPDGTQLAYPGIDDGSSPMKAALHFLWVRTVDSTSPVKLQIPARPTFTVVAWETADDVIVEVRQPYDHPAAAYRPALVGLLRCSATSGECERVRDGPTGRAALPAPYY